MNTVTQESNRDCCSVAQGILQLALENQDAIHIHLAFCAHVNWIRVRVHLPIAIDGHDDPIIEDFISLESNRHEDDATPLAQLLELEDKLVDLIAEAKDRLELVA